MSAAELKSADEQTRAAPAGLEPGMREVVAGRYRLIRKLAAGGMGSVFIAEHLLSHKRMALKVVHPYLCRGRQGTERFRREVSAAAQIDHPGIVQVFDAGVDDDGGFFMAMELLEGESIGDHLRREWPGMATSVRWIEGMLAPLAKAHAKGFVHRDLKPDNVFLSTDEAGNTRLKLLDFGLARDVSKGGPTRTGITFGTPEYMSPEQAMSARKVRSPGDVWSVGVMLYELLSGQHPFTGETPNAIMANAIKEPLPPLSETAPHVPADLARVIERALEKDPEDRPQTAGEMLAELRDALATLELDESVPEAPTPPPRWDESEEPPVSSDFPIRPQANVPTFVGEGSADARPSGVVRSVSPRPPMNRTLLWAGLAAGLLMVFVLSGTVYWLFSEPTERVATQVPSAAEIDSPEVDPSPAEPVSAIDPTTPRRTADPEVSAPGSSATGLSAPGSDDSSREGGGASDQPPEGPVDDTSDDGPSSPNHAADTPSSDPSEARRAAAVQAAEQVRAARACGDDASCAIQALRGVRSGAGLHMLIGLYQRTGHTSEALDAAQRYVRRYGNRPQAEAHRAFLRDHGR